MEQQILDFIRRVYEAIGWPGVVLLMAIESACIPLPSEIIMPLAGWMLISEKGLGWEWVLLAGVFGGIGNVIGSAVAYWAGAWGGRPFLRRYGKYFLITEHDIEKPTGGSSATAIARPSFRDYCQVSAHLLVCLPGLPGLPNCVFSCTRF
jgi:membrane protein DedA with SNARE-associated domain